MINMVAIQRIELSPQSWVIGSRVGTYFVLSLSAKVRPDLTRLARETFLSPCTTSLAGLSKTWKSS